MIRNDLPRSLIDNPRINSWIGFEQSGRVRLGTGKVELGQGVLTALRQMAAEELEVDPERIAVISGDTAAETPEEGFTAGSQSIEVSGGSIRLVCAEVRQIFLHEAARRLGLDVQALRIEDGRILDQQAPTTLDYWSLARDIDLARPITGSAPVREAASLRLIGRSLPRTDLPAKLGGAAFIHDRTAEDMLHARVLRVPRRNARLTALNEAAIQRTGAEILRDHQFVALLADDEAVAVAALELAQRGAVWSGGDDLRPEQGEAHYLRQLGSVDRVIEAAGTDTRQASNQIVEASYSRPYLAHASIGPSCALARWDGDALTVWTHSQGVGPLRASLARAVGITPERVEVKHMPGAGCYGHNGADDVACDAALIAVRRPSRTVRVQWMRDDELSAGPVGAPSVVRLRAALDADGMPAIWNMELWSPTHAQRPGMNGAVNLLAAEALSDEPGPRETVDVPDAGGGGGVRNCIALYDLPTQHIRHHLIQGAPLRTSALRGLGTQANVFAIESFIDELALAAGRDPVDYRLAMMKDPRARAVIEAAARMCSWHERGAGSEGVGLGFAFSRYKNKAAYLAAAAEVELDEEVRVRRIWCAVDAGLVVNPDGAANQVEGGAIQATSWTIKEQVRMGPEGISTRSWDDYPILRFSEVPDVEVAFVGTQENPTLGVGEVAVGPVTAAIGNAVAHALGMRLRDLPFTRERITAALLAETGS